MPEFLHEVPVSNNTSFDGVDYFVGTIQAASFFPDTEIQSITGFAIATAPSSMFGLVASLAD